MHICRVDTNARLNYTSLTVNSTFKRFTGVLGLSLSLSLSLVNVIVGSNWVISLINNLSFLHLTKHLHCRSNTISCSRCTIKIILCGSVNLAPIAVPSVVTFFFFWESSLFYMQTILYHVVFFDTVQQHPSNTK